MDGKIVACSYIRERQERAAGRGPRTVYSPWRQMEKRGLSRNPRARFLTSCSGCASDVLVPPVRGLHCRLSFSVVSDKLSFTSEENSETKERSPNGNVASRGVLCRSTPLQAGPGACVSVIYAQESLQNATKESTVRDHTGIDPLASALDFIKFTS